MSEEAWKYLNIIFIEGDGFSEAEHSQERVEQEPVEGKQTAD